MFADTAELFKKHGYKVRVYNLLQPEYSDSWNCMFDLGGDTLMAQILTDVIISNTKGDEKGDHFWDNGESNLLKSLILYVDLDSTRTPEERNLAAVYQMLTQHTEKELTMLFDRLPHRPSGQGAVQPVQPGQRHRARRHRPGPWHQTPGAPERGRAADHPQLRHRPV